jgi:hypothetical protein
MDAGLIPFYIFIGMLAHANYQMVPNTADRWTSYFDSDDATAELINAIYFVAGTTGALHAISLLLDLYLVIMFRKIASLPPDMNPLEEKKDNLTRRKTKHKYKNSEITLVDEKHLSDFTVSSISTPNRVSRASEADRDSKAMSFIQSRNGGDGSFSPHNPKTADMIRGNMYQQSNAAASRVDLHTRGNSFAETEYSDRTSPMPAMPMSPKRSTTGSAVSSLHSFETTSSKSGISAILDDRSDAENNWFAIGDGVDDDQRHSPHSRRPHLHEITNMVSPRAQAYHRLTQESPSQAHHAQTMSPLRMNPPTPPPAPIAARIATQPISPHLTAHTAYASSDTANDERTRTMTSAVSALTSSSAYSTDSAFATYGTAGRSVGAPKRQFYGDLASAMRGVRQQAPAEPRPKSLVGSVHYMDEGEVEAIREKRRSEVGSVSGTVVRKGVVEGKRTSYHSGYGRVVSRSGVDVLDADGDLGTMRGRRDVSGKVAEEGRGGPSVGGWFGSGLLRRSSRMNN